MKINEIDYYFKSRSDKDIALNIGAIYKDLGYSKIDKTKILQTFKIHEKDLKQQDYLNQIYKSVVDVNSGQESSIEKIACQLQNKWQGFKQEYFEIIKKIFGIQFNYDITEYSYCYLQQLPINEIDVKDRNIYLDCNKDIDEIFKNFIVMLTKLLMLVRWNSVNNWNFNIEFDYKNKIWMFAEIAIDAVFYNSALRMFCNNPSYKYFYNLKVKDVNTMQHFRQLYLDVELDEFFTEVYMFVHDNYKKLLQFKSYLY